MMQSSIIIVADMADVKALPVKMLGREFMFSCRNASKLVGWVPEEIYVTDRAWNNMSDEVEYMIKAKKAQGSKICPVN